MKKFARTYKDYREACYGDMVLQPIQAREVKQAFYAGALKGLSILIEAMECGQDEKELNETIKELFHELSTELRPT